MPHCRPVKSSGGSEPNYKSKQHNELTTNVSPRENLKEFYARPRAALLCSCHREGRSNRLCSIVKVLGYVNVAPGFHDMPKVVNGESDLLVRLWGGRGQHARAAVGVASLSREAPVETEVIVQIRE